MSKQKIQILEKSQAKFNVLKKEELTKHYGFVAILDALGTKNANFDEIYEFLKNHLFIIDLLKYIDPILKKLNKKNIDFRPEFFPFQDSVIITLDIFSKDNLIYALNYFGTIIQFYISSSFIFNILFRGALSYGNYYKYKEKHYFGEAINDAASWYEEPNFFGAISTPKLNNYINYLLKTVDTLNLQSEIDGTKFQEIFLSTLVNTKSGNKPFWTINWPIALSWQNTRPEDKINPDLNALEVYYTLINNKVVTKGTEDKYINTNNYVETIFKIFPQYLNYYRPDEKNYQELKSDL